MSNFRSVSAFREQSLLAQRVTCATMRGCPNRVHYLHAVLLSAIVQVVPVERTIAAMQSQTPGKSRPKEALGGCGLRLRFFLHGQAVLEDKYFERAAQL